MSRKKPYSTNQESWNSIFRKRLRIPMNQREYSWEQKEINKFLVDMTELFEENEYVLKMGSIINLAYDNTNDIYDGQQRLLTTLLILYVLGRLSPKLKNAITHLLTMDILLEKLTPEQEKLKEEYKVSKIPKIYCINPYDMKGIVMILNDKIKSPVEFMDNIQDIEYLDEEDMYICKHCDGVEIASKRDFIRHIEKQHAYELPDKTTKLYNAFIYIYDYLTFKKYDELQLIDLYKFIINDIDIQYFDFDCPTYVTRTFDWENNRGKAVETLDIIKNQVLVPIPQDKRFEVYDKWEKLKHSENKIYKKKFGQKIFDIAIQIYNNNISRKIIHEELFKPIITSENSYEEIKKFFKIIEELLEIMEKISNDKYGRLINNTSRVCITWEGYMWLFLPIFYRTRTINSELIKLVTKWYFRNLQFNTYTFNNLGYSNEFIRTTNEVLKDPAYDYYKDVEECLKKNKDPQINDEHFIRELSNSPFKSTNATHTLLFLETCINTDIQNVPLDYTLEHIYSQKYRSSLVNPSLMDNIGNQTLLEGKNSSNGHKGNSSLGAKTYGVKKKSYKDSSSKITRNIANDYENFDENDIIHRNTQIVNMLNEYTNY